MFKISNSKNISLDKIYKGAQDLYNEIPRIKRKRKIKRLAYLLHFTLISIIIIVLFLVIVFAVHFVNFKIISSQLKDSKRNLEYSVFLINNNKYNEAIFEAKQTRNILCLAKESLEEYRDNYLFSKNNYLKNQLQYLIDILTSAEIFTDTIERLAMFGINFQKINNQIEVNFNDMEDAKRSEILNYIYESTPELNGMKANLELAVINLENIKKEKLANFLQEDFNKLSLASNEVNDFLERIIPSFELLPIISGSPGESNFLFVMQNSEKVKAPANQIEVYGIMNIKNGKITNFETKSARQLDESVSDKFWFLTPKLIKNNFGINRWYLGDANLSSDWPEAAKNIKWLFEKENKVASEKLSINKIDGIILVTPAFLEGLLNYFGPINGIDTNNYFSFIIEDGDKVGKLFQEIEERIYNLPSGELWSVTNIIQQSIYEKNILFYFEDEYYENLAKEQGWAGQIEDTTGDYLLVSDFSVVKDEANSLINKNIYYSVIEDSEEVFSKIFIDYSNNYKGNAYGSYKTYLRVYTPKGSELVRSEEIKIGEVDKYEEFGKTVFGILVEVNPGEINRISLEYKLPQGIKKMIQDGVYTLTIQKQPGSSVNKLTVDFDPQNRIKSYEPTGFYVNSDRNKIRWETSLDRDKKFQIFIEN